MRPRRFVATLAASIVAAIGVVGVAVPAHAEGITPGGLARCDRHDKGLPVTGALTAGPVTGAEHLVVGENVNVATEFCNKGGEVESNIVVLALHGAARDHRLFNPPTSSFEPTIYSLVRRYTHDGLPVVNVDRVGAGASDRVLPSTAVNLQSEARAYSKLVAMLRAGTYAPGVPAFGKVVLLGHSFGASIANEMSAFHDLVANPSLSGSPDTHTDATILLGFRHPGPNPPGVVALGASILPASPPGYIQANPAVAATLEFSPFADPAIVAAAASLGSTATDGQLGTFPLSFSPVTAAAVTNPVLSINGELDPIMCSVAPSYVTPGLECTVALLTATESAAYVNAASLTVMVQPQAAHLMMWHPNADALAPSQGGTFPKQTAWIFAHV